MADTGSDLTSSDMESEREGTLFNVAVGKHEFPFSYLRMISALAAEISMIVMSTKAAS